MDKDNYHEINQYEDPAFPVQLFRASHGWMVPRSRGLRDFHWHEELQLTVAVKGSLTYQIDGGRYFLKAGEGVFINSGIIHAVTELSEDGRYDSLNFPVKLLSFFAGSRMETECVAPLVAGRCPPVICLVPEVAWQRCVLEIFSEISGLWDGETTVYREYLVSVKIVTLWYILASNFSEKGADKPASDPVHRQRLQEMLSFIYAHFDEEITLSDIAGAAHISTGECCRIFRGHLGTSPYRYLTEYRIRNSIQWLLGGRSVEETARACGYSQTSNYIAKFKSVMGTTPAKYRKFGMKE